LRMVDIAFQVALTIHALHCLQQTSPLLCCVRHVDLRLPRPSNMALAVPRISGLCQSVIGIKHGRKPKQSLLVASFCFCQFTVLPLCQPVVQLVGRPS
jgi:hypothetical protein